jgi:hypothetical protein
VDATQKIVAADTTRLDGMRVIGVDEHRWSHTRGRDDGDGIVTLLMFPCRYSSRRRGAAGDVMLWVASAVTLVTGGSYLMTTLCDLS